jgi:Holliday junction resolvase
MIIAHNNDYKIFNKLLLKSVSCLQKDAENRKDYYIGRGGINLEKDVFRIINKNAVDTIYEENIELVSGQKFPDIVAYVNENKAYGIEVKTTKQKKYARLATWLVSRFGIVNHALRDTFSAGGKIKIKGILFPKIFKYIDVDLDKIYENIKNIQKDDIKHYWELDSVKKDSIKLWKQQCLNNCSEVLKQKQLRIIKQLLK